MVDFRGSSMRVLQSIHSVALWQFFLATFVIFPKIAVFVFVGSRLASLSDGKQRSHMDTSKSLLMNHTSLLTQMI